MNITWKKVVAIAGGITITIAAADVVIDKAGSVQTDSEAEAWRSTHILTEAEKFKADRVDRVERESDRLEYDLLDVGLSPEQKVFKQRQLQKNDQKVKCIQESTC